MNISFLKEKGSKYILIVLLGLLILVMCIPTGTNSSEIKTESQSTDMDLEHRLEQVLSAMDGVGEVEVMITVEGSTENMFSTKSDGVKASGVLVVAEGAGKASVDAQILEAVKALFSIDVHKISIVKMKSQEERK